MKVRQIHFTRKFKPLAVFFELNDKKSIHFHKRTRYLKYMHLMISVYRTYTFFFKEQRLYHIQKKRDPGNGFQIYFNKYTNFYTVIFENKVQI